MQSFIPLEWVLWVLGLWNSVAEWSEKAWDTTKEIYTAVSAVFRPKEFYFFDGSGTAHLRPETLIFASGSARPQWLYEQHTNTFYEWVGSETRLISQKPFALPILSLDLKEEGQPTHYDLTDFLEGVKVLRATTVGWKSPSLAQVLGAWKLASGIVVDVRRFRGHVMTDTAEERELDLADTRPLDHALSLEEGEIEESAEASAEPPAPGTEAASIEAVD